MVMQSLVDRLKEVMSATGWTRADLMRISKQSSSVVSQWLGNGSKEIKTIGKLEAAVYLERASGFSCLWIAKGVGPKRVSPSPAAIRAEQSTAPYEVATAPNALDSLESLLRAAPVAHREPIATNLAGWARDGGCGPWRDALQALLTSAKPRRAA